VNPPGDRFEQEADRVADAVMTNPSKGVPGIGDTDGHARLSRLSPSLQRTAKFVPGTVSEDVNPAEQIAENKIPERNLFLGQTNFLLNGTSFTGITPDARLKALHTPKIASASSTASTGSGSDTVKAVECWFDSAADNKGSYEMKLLKKDRWTHITSKKNVAGRFPTLKACKKGSGDVTFVVKGEPKDEDLRMKVQAHEKHHADDDEAIFNNVLVPWDAAVTKAHKDKSKVTAGDISICEKVLYSSLGREQKPNDIVSKIAQNITTQADTFHNSGEGGKPPTKVEEFDSDCNLVKVRTG
jgi:hypothetical protein